MKILHIITGLNNGGAEAVLFRLCKYDTKNEHIVISMMDMGKYGSLLEKENIKVFTLDMPAGKLKIGAIIKLYKLIKKLKPDVVQTWMYHANLIGGFVAKIARIKKIIWGIHHSNLDESHNKKSTILIAKILAKVSKVIPTTIVYCAEKALEVHKDIGYKCDDMQVIANGYELDMFYPNDTSTDKLRLELNIKKHENIVGFVARFDELKDHDNLLQALQIVKKKKKDFKCLFVGANMIESNETLKKMILKYNLENQILLLGERNDIPNIMNLLDIHILSSYSEAFPNVLCEAMACGTPCITTDVGDAAFIVGDTGWVVPIKDSSALSTSILNALTEKNDSQENFKGRQMKVRKRIVEKFDILKMIDDYDKIYKGIE